MSKNPFQGSVRQVRERWVDIGLNKVEFFPREGAFDRDMVLCAGKDRWIPKIWVKKRGLCEFMGHISVGRMLA